MRADFYFTPNERLEFNKQLVANNDLVDQRIDFKDNTDLINPTFIYRADKWDDTVNYIYVKSPLNRYYFVENVTFSQMYIEINCSIDVLSSHYNEILKLTGIVERNAHLYNMYLTDTKLKTFNLTRIQTFPWLDGGGNPKGFFDGDGNKTASYVLTMSGGGTDEEEEE